MSVFFGTIKTVVWSGGGFDRFLSFDHLDIRFPSQNHSPWVFTQTVLGVFFWMRPIDYLGFFSFESHFFCYQGLPRWTCDVKYLKCALFFFVFTSTIMQKLIWPGCLDGLCSHQSFLTSSRFQQHRYIFRVKSHYIWPHKSMHLHSLIVLLDTKLPCFDNCRTLPDSTSLSYATKLGLQLTASISTCHVPTQASVSTPVVYPETGFLS